MDEIYKRNGCWTAKENETNAKQCSINQNIRKKLLFGFSDLFLGDHYKAEPDDNTLCLCGFSITNCCVVRCEINGEKAIIGSNCVRKYYPKVYSQLKEYKRKTKKCNFCLKRVKKDDHHCFKKKEIEKDINQMLMRHIMDAIYNSEKERIRLLNKCSRSKCDSKSNFINDRKMPYCKNCWRKKEKLIKKGKLTR